MIKWLQDLFTPTWLKLSRKQDEYWDSVDRMQKHIDQLPDSEKQKWGRILMDHLKNNKSIKP